MADRNIKVCDRCEAFEAKARAVDLVVYGTETVTASMLHLVADLCDTCWAHVETVVRRAMSKPTPRKGADNASAT